MAENPNDQQMVNDDDDKNYGTAYITLFTSYPTFPDGATNVIMMMMMIAMIMNDDANIAGETKYWYWKGLHWLVDLGNGVKQTVS